MAAAAAEPTAKTVICPNCHTANVPQALFCESCGYDFMTGTVPDNPWAQTPAAPAPLAPPISAADEAAALQEAIQAYQAETSGPISTDPEATPAPATQPVGLDGQDWDKPAEAAAEPTAPTPALQPSQGAAGAVAPVQELPLEWIAELWIDPDWYELQGSPDPLPSAGLPDIIPLVKRSNLIGRTSISKQITPEIDCDLDTGCSRRHAMLTTDGTRWWIEDLDSANGTFVGPANGPLPSMPIPRGKVELALDQRIYLGAWTRIVIRKATEDELDAFTG
jgi:hypothetical protein